MTPDVIELIRVKRAAGWHWDAIAFEMYPYNVDVTGDTLRKRYARAIGLKEPPKPAPTQLPLPLKTSFAFPGQVKVLYLPDTQVRKGVELSHFLAAGRYAAAKQVDVIAHAGDFLDYYSISTYHSPRSKEGVRLKDDVDAAIEALELFKSGLAGYRPKLQFLTLGNHEDRLRRYIDEHPELEGTLELPPFEAYGWTTYPFLQPVVVNGVHFAHYFTRTASGWAGTNPHKSAQLMTRREMVSCVAGHSPGLDTYIHPAGGASGLIRGTIAGSFYQHDETYQGPQGNRYWRGMLMMHEVAGGYWNQNEVSMAWLLENYCD